MSDAIYLRAQAERCFRLARGAVGPRLADELEGLGRSLKQEATEVEERLMRLSAQQSTSVSQHYAEAGRWLKQSEVFVSDFKV
jgi:hypothetical protein